MYLYWGDNMVCATIKVLPPEQPAPPPSVGAESYLPIVAILGAAALAYYIRKR